MLCFMLERGVWIPALLSCFRPSSGFVSGFGHSYPRLGLAVGACGLEFARAVRSSVQVHSLSSFSFLLFCLVLCGTQLVFFTGCVLSCLSCFVWTLGLWVSLLAAFSCPVLHMAMYMHVNNRCLIYLKKRKKDGHQVRYFSVIWYDDYLNSCVSHFLARLSFETTDSLQTGIGHFIHSNSLVYNLHSWI